MGLVVAMVAAAASAAEAPSGASPAVREALRTIRATHDAQGLPFALVDKTGAMLHVFGADGRLRGSAPALLGQQRGDASDPTAPRLLRRNAVLPVAMRTTPAGRYASEPGLNLKGDNVVWFDYDAALAIHRLRPAPAHEQRPQRLLSPTPDDNRITLGCVVVAPAFFDAVVAPLLGRSRGVVYVLPEEPAAGVAAIGPRPD